MFLPLLIAVVIVLTGCSREKSETPAKVTSEGVDVKNPLGVLGTLASAGKDMEKIQAELEKMPATDPVHFSKLIAVLPDPPDGWAAEAPRGSINQMGDFKMSEAKRSYSKGDDERVSVEIVDWAFNKSMYLGFFMAAKFSQETTEGYSKGITLGEDPGRDEYQIQSKHFSRSVLLKKRFFAKIDIDGAGPDAINDWWGRLKTSALP